MPAFDIIPVIDLKGGRAVRGAGGNRAAYQPLATPLCPDGEPLSAVAGLLRVCPSPVVYIADLDAIEGEAPQRGAIRDIAETWPELELWVDSGLADAAALAGALAGGAGRPVLGSESLGEAIPPIDDTAILSLDFRGDRFLGPPALLTRPASWPRDVIAMCLHSVGAGAGPDFERLARVVAMAGGRRVYAAGGVRDVADLEALARIGAAGALVSSALHSGVITGADLHRLTPAPKGGSL